MKTTVPASLLLFSLLAACSSGNADPPDPKDGGRDLKPAPIDTNPPPEDTTPPRLDTNPPLVAALQSLTLSAAQPSLTVGSTQPINVVGSYDDGSKKDLTSKVTWTASPASIATVSTVGVVKGVAVGAVTIRAELDGKAGTLDLTVVPIPRVLTAFQATAAAASVEMGNTVKLTASGTYSDGSKMDVTTQATWTAADVTVATVSAQGVATAVSAGTAIFKASLEGKESMVTVVVTKPAPVLTGVLVSAPFATMAVGSSLSLVATGTYSDGAKKDISSTATWTTSDAALAIVSGAGTVSGVAAGSVTIQAAFLGKTGSVALTVTPAPLILVGLVVTAGDASVPAGAKVQLTAMATYSDGSKKDISKTALWTSSATNLATIAADGLATTLTAGTVTFTAKSEGKSGTETLTIMAAQLSSIDVTPDLPTLAAGNQQKFVATGTYTDGSKHVITEQVDWTSSSAEVATISGAPGTKGTVTGVAKGKTTITASLTGKSGTSELTVTDAVLTAITVTPTKPVIAKTTVIQLHAVGTFSDNSTKDLTADATWSTSDGAIATVSNATGSDGRVTGVSAGTATITASRSGKSGTITIKVTNATLASITLAPLAVSIANGTTQQFAATGIFSDQSKQDITTQVSWLSSDPTLASIANGGEKVGLASALKVGQMVISAALQGKSASTPLTVTAATLTSIAISASPTTIARGTRTQFAAIGTYSDGSKQTLTEQVTWESSAKTVATISNSQTDGLATAVGAGTTTLKATRAGKSDSITLTVTSATLSSMAITPKNPTVVDGVSRALTATGTFSDGTKQDLTAQANWSSSDAAIATVSNNRGEQGEAQGQKPGKVTLVAACLDKSATVELTVTPAERTQIVLEPLAPQMAKGTTGALVAKAIYTDGSEEVITNQVTWVSSNPAVATVQNDVNQQGHVFAVAQGTTVISIALGTFTARVTLTVTAATLSALAISPATAATVAKGSTLAFTVFGTFSDSTVQNLTLQAVWTSSNTALATISSSPGSDGRATGIAAGNLTITATVMEKTATAPLTVTLL